MSDYFGLEDLLSPEDVALRKRVRRVMEEHVAPVVTKVCSLKNSFFIYFILFCFCSGHDLFHLRKSEFINICFSLFFNVQILS